MAAVAVVATVALIGVGTANASDRRKRWPWPTRPKPSASASAKPTGTATQPAPSQSASASPTRSNGTGTSPSPTSTTPAGAIKPLPVNQQFDYQIGGAYTPPSGTKIVSRDHTAQPAAGLYNICYVNAYQTQDFDAADWLKNRKDLVLHKNGNPVGDTKWKEYVLDITTDAKRQQLAAIFNAQIDDCKTKKFDAIEIDNLDTYSRSQGLITADHAIAYAKLLIDHAHGKGLAIGQKNSLELGTRGKQAGFDFAIAEQCGEFNECGEFTAIYGDSVIMIEYARGNFDKTCKGFGAKVSVVLRDEDVTPGGVYAAC
ncbi:endo alpha-1,4 polygalactosaminidase [Virgisporangium aliadipatigenens]|uniref:endo alpha-1,4 polygalactosaminidase n=1 Tax=Virgisporangium aliadipatigenens TaxID=741659 RepID=UPI001EF21865|nr:endo alpha-1,4 polygalactosaminidase [Virgisporangium aliadipatigenens]